MAASVKIPREIDKDKSAKDILLTRQELMDYLKIKQGTLRKLMLNNEFPYFSWKDGSSFVKKILTSGLRPSALERR